ncbi:MAG: hypothetical protein KF847_09455 [Pirellulales bacterium]|nr:hypothetical protein [Pirellulales bacterium]
MIEDLDARVSQAVKLFWRTRAKQAKNQGSATGKKDAGSRTAATPASVGDTLFVRTAGHLWAFAEP